ncbi:hypothetical protein ACR780_07095 [Sphingobacterium faecium]|uniref:hypothetical protein n=1 Tax=Sphingobacterium faecium TaxID=34087 RepID=UPI003DA441C9
MKIIIKTMLLVVLLSATNNVLGQQKVSYKNQIKRSVDVIFATYEKIDSISIQFQDNEPKDLYIYVQRDSANIPNQTYRHIYYSALDFQGDVCFIKKNYPLIYDLIFNKKLKASIKKPKDEKVFRIVIDRKNAYFRNNIHATSLNTSINKEILEKFLLFLNDNNKDLVIAPEDSILIFQAVVNRNGIIAENEALHGNKDQLYTYFFKNYEYFNKNILNSDKINIYSGLIIPYTKGGRPFQSIIDVYIRANADKTFTISANGRERKLKIKKYVKEDQDLLMIL